MTAPTEGAALTIPNRESEAFMSDSSLARVLSALALGLSIGLAGCSRGPSGGSETAPTPVTVSFPMEKVVTDYADFTARTAAVDSVEVRAHVWGYLDKVNFKEGDLVKQGDVLFEIDPRTYQCGPEPGRGQPRVNGGPARATRRGPRAARRMVGTGAIEPGRLRQGRW